MIKVDQAREPYRTDAGDDPRVLFLLLTGSIGFGLRDKRWSAWHHNGHRTSAASEVSGNSKRYPLGISQW